MRKIFTSIFFTIICVVCAHAQYITNGDNTVYTFESLSQIENSGVTVEDGAYIVASNIEISENDTLRLANNDIIKLKDTVTIMIKGYGDLAPSDTASIIKYNDEAVPKYIHFTGSNSAGAIKNITLVNVPIRYFGDKNLNIENCTFTGITTNYSAINLGTTAQTNVLRCRFIENSYPAIAGAANTASPVLFKENYLYKNSLTASNRPQINLTVGGNGSIEIIDNFIYGPAVVTKNGGIAVSNLLGIGGSNEVVISGNLVRDCRYGITTSGVMDAKIINNRIIDNKYESVALNGGSGISISNSAGGQKTIITGNYIAGNLWGITNIGNLTAGKSANVNLGNLTPGDNYNEGLNVFENNGNNGVLYDFYNNTTNDVYAQGNTWGVATQDSTSIETVVFHKADNETLGQVIFMATESSSIQKNITDDNVIFFDESNITLTINTSYSEVLIYTTSGKLVFKSTEDKKNLSLSTLPKGVYAVIVKDKATVYSKKIIF